MSAAQRAIEALELTASEEFRKALELAAQNAADVDRRGRFPAESVGALKAAGALGWGVPAAYGGAGAGTSARDDCEFVYGGFA